MSSKKKKPIKPPNALQGDVLKIDKTFQDAVKATMFVADKKIRGKQ